MATFPVIVVPVPQTMKFSEAQRLNQFGMERLAANKIMEVIRDIEEQLSLDDLTLGAGNCMIIAIIQQCKREDILPLLPQHIQSLVQGTITVDMTTEFRKAVKEFVTESESDPAITAISESLPDKSWPNYWEKMMRVGEWGDEVFLNCVARLLRINILVVSHGSTKAFPYYCINGRDEPSPAGDSSDSGNLYIGYTGMERGLENHYQSLLPSTSVQGSVSVAQPVFDFSCEKSPKLSPQKQRIQKDRERQTKLKGLRKVPKSQPKPNLSEEEKEALKREKTKKRVAALRERQRAADPDNYTATMTKMRGIRRDKEKAAAPECYLKCK